MTYKITGLKHFRSVEGFAYSANLRKGNKKVAEVRDDGWGGPLCVDFVSQDEEQAFRDECHTNYRETIKEFYSDVCEGHTEDLPLYMQRFDARDYSTPTEPNSANGRYFIGADDPVETICALLCEEKLPSY